MHKTSQNRLKFFVWWIVLIKQWNVGHCRQRTIIAELFGIQKDKWLPIWQGIMFSVSLLYLSTSLLISFSAQRYVHFLLACWDSGADNPIFWLFSFRLLHTFARKHLFSHYILLVSHFIASVSHIIASVIHCHPT